MKYACPKCRTVLFITGPLDKEGKHRGIDREIRFEYQEKGTFVACANKRCPEKFPVTFSEKNGLPVFQVLGLVRMQ